jgi:hypothetical protein
VEVFDFRAETWGVFAARLSIARHQASICELNGYLYVVGGHTIALPDEFINSVERCPISSVQSQFDLINLQYN